MEWTREKTLSLISEYRKRRGLWDMTHDDYRKKEIKQKLLIEVSTSLGGGIPIIEIEKKFHTLRTQYHREINRMKRKEPYNSKWFGFKNLQFLSSPKACRSNKGRIPSKEITEEGTVTTKYIIRETPGHLELSSGSVNSSTSLINEEFLTIHRKPTTITYEVAPGAPASGSAGGGAATSTSTAAAAATAAASSRAHELEKLIEETTKDVEEIEEERKPKMSIKQLNVEHHQQHSYESGGGGEAGEMEAVEDEEEPLLIAQDQLQIHEDDDEAMETTTVELHNTNDEEIAYQSSSSTGGGHHHAQTSANSNIAVQQQQHSQPARFIKIQRRDTSNEIDYEYEQRHQVSVPHHHHQQQTQSPTFKRIHYDTNGHHHTATIINTATPTATHQPNANSTLLNPTSVKLQRQHQRSNVTIAQAQQTSALNASTLLRDEFVTYGEYVANEMRGITKREVLVALKHKINTALFEASMAELQK